MKHKNAADSNAWIWIIRTKVSSKPLCVACVGHEIEDAGSGPNLLGKVGRRLLKPKPIRRPIESDGIEGGRIGMG